MSDIDILPSADREKKLNALKQFEENVEYVAKTVHGEARGENRTTKTAIAWVIKNRMYQKHKSAKEIVKQPSQFDCWNDTDANDENYMASSDPESYCSDNKVRLEAWEECISVAREVLSSQNSNDITDGATHYFDSSIALPYWADPQKEKNVTESTVDGASSELRFFKGIRY